MKLVVAALLCVCTAKTLASVLPGAGGAADVAKEAQGKLVDWAQTGVVGQTSVAGAKNAGRTNANSGDSARQAASSGQQAGSASAQKGSSRDSTASVADKAASKSSAAQGEQLVDRLGAAWQKDARDQTWSANTDFGNGDRLKDKVDYVFDKNYDNEDSQTGGFVYSQRNNADAVDNNYDRASAYDRNVNKWAGAAKKADQQSAGRDWQARQDAAAGSSAKDKFGRDTNQGNSAWNGRQASSNLLDSTNLVGERGILGANGGNEQAQSSLLNDADSRNEWLGATAFDSEFGGGGYGFPALGGLGGYGGGRSRGAGSGDFTGASQIAARNNLQSRKGVNFGDIRNAELGSSLWAGDNAQGFGDSRGTFLNDQGYSDAARNAANRADATNSDRAGAQTGRDASQSVADFAENARNSDNVKWNFADSNQGSQVVKKFFNDDNKKGNNRERLKFNSDDLADKYAFKNDKRGDSARAASDGSQTVRDLAKTAASNVARAADAGQTAQQSDWQAQKAGVQSQQAAAWADASKGVDGYSNGAQQAEAAQSRADNGVKKASQWDLSAGKAAALGAARGGLL